MSNVIEIERATATRPESLDAGHHLFVCDRCGHRAGDPRTHNFRARCPGCEFLVKFYRVID